MIGQMQEIVSEKTQALAEQVQKMRKESAESVREAVTGSAESLKALKSPVRLFARSGIKVTTVSQTAVQSLIELQSEMITSALTDMAVRLERAARAEGIIDLVKDQVDMLPATRARIVDDATRAVSIFKHAGRELRTVATHTYEKVVEAAEEEVPEVKVARRKVKRAVRKTTTRARKAA
jgi:predicted Fe-Mo cluster-binding NifX family protein